MNGTATPLDQLRPASTIPSRRIGRRQRWTQWARRLVFGALVLLVVLASSGMLYQAFAEARDRRNLPVPGQLVDVGGYRLHLQIMGEHRGGPTVILDAAAGSMAAEWAWVQPEVARFTQVVAYDRPGQGYSEVPPTPRDVAALIDDLRTALHTAGIDGPYVLVGHSMGGLFMRAFAKLYPHEVVGMVLVDSRYLGVDDVVPVDERLPDNRAQLAWQLPLMARLGVFRLQNINGEYVAQLPPQAARTARAALAATQQWNGFVPDTYVADSAEMLLRQGEDVGTMPVVVLSAEQPDPYNFSTPAERERFTALHAHMASTLGQRGKHQVVAGADHASIVTQQQHAAVVTEAVREVVAEAQ